MSDRLAYFDLRSPRAAVRQYPRAGESTKVKEAICCVGVLGWAPEIQSLFDSQRRLGGSGYTQTLVAINVHGGIGGEGLPIILKLDRAPPSVSEIRPTPSLWDW